MKKNKKIMILASGIISAVVFSGCATKIKVDVVEPAKEIKNISAVAPLLINVKNNVNVAAADKAFVAGMISQQISGALYKEGFYTVADNVWGDIHGAASLYRAVDQKKQKHGYVNFSTYSGFPCATLNITVDGNINIKKERIKKDIVLKIKHYRHDYSKGEPFAVVSSEKRKVQPAEFDQWTIVVNGKLSVVLIDKKNKEVYKKDFDKLQYKYVTSDSRGDIIPTPAVALHRAISNAVEAVIADISPRKCVREIEIAKGGDEKAFLLLKNNAFEDAIDRIESLAAPQADDYVNLGIAYEVLGEFSTAVEQYEKALKLSSGHSIATDRLANIDFLMKKASMLKKSGAAKAAKKSAVGYRK